MIRTFEGFAGFGGGSFGLSKANIDFECVGYSEVDKYAIQCYEQNHPNIKNFGSIKDINPIDLPDFDLFLGGFPCQDVSLAGKRDLTKGRTMLINDVFRILEVKKPTYVVLENVKGLLSMTNLWDSIRWTLKNLGYGVSYKVLNSKDFGIPQNRERIWIVCKLGGFEFLEFQFPEKKKLKLSVLDLLEDDIDKKYYLKDNQIAAILKSDFNDRKPKSLNVMSTLKIGGDVPCIIHPTITTSLGRQGSSKEFIKSCLTVHNTQTRSQNRPSLLKNKNAGGSGHLSKDDGTTYCLDSTNSQCIELNYRRHISDEFKHQNNISPTLLSSGGSGNDIIMKQPIWRRLTPKECFRLMGFLNDNINLKGLSDTQKYKLAGNGWDINVVSLVLKNLLQKDNNVKQLQ